MPKPNCSCYYCGKELYRKPCRLKNNCRVFCNASEHMKFNYENGLIKGSEIIKKAQETLRIKGHYKRDNSYLSRGNHVSREARERLSKERMGSGNPMWNKTPWNKLPVTKKWWEEKEFVELRKLVLVRDNFICVNCSKGSIDLYCDHIVPYRICKEHKLGNLQMLCGSCHSKKTVYDLKNYPELKNPNCKSTLLFKTKE